jgi:putative transposase
MKHDRRSSLRLKDFDYTQPGPYFIATVMRGRENLFGEIVDGKIRVNPFGQIVAETWQWLETQYPYLELGVSVVMPDHFHGIIYIGDLPRSDGERPIATKTSAKIKPLGQLIGAFKTVSAKRINLLRGTPGISIWQRNFHERIVRDEIELTRIHQYILDNPIHWQEDENPGMGEPVFHSMFDERL